MSCQYQKDSEIAEKYLLDRLSDKEKTEFEKHLRDCPICQERIEREKLLFAALQKIGREELKDDLKEQLQSSAVEKSSYNWGMLLKAAAVLLFFVLTPGIIYYYQEVMPREEDQISNELQKPLAEKSRIEGDLLKEEGAGGSSYSAREPQGMVQDGEIAARSNEGDAVSRSKKTEALSEPAEQTAPVGRDEAGAISNADRIQDKLAIRRSVEEEKVPRSQKQGTTEFDREKSLSSTPPATAITAENMAELSEIAPMESKGKPTSWQFSSDGQQINVRPIQTKTGTESEEAFPDSFPVRIIRQDSAQLDMEWIVPQNMIELNPGTIQLGRNDKNQLNVFINSQLLFQMDLQKDSTYARQIISPKR
jgi:hypothetical protein